MSWGGVKTLSKACAVPLLLSPVFITSFALAADPSSNPNEPIEITKGESYTDIVGQEVSIPNSDRSWISNTDGTFSGSWDSVNFSTSNNKIINNVSIDNLATTNITIKGNSETKFTNNVNNEKVYGFYNRNGNLTLEQKEASKVDVSINNTSSSGNRTTYGIFNVNKVYGQVDKIYDEILGDTLDVSAVQADSKIVLKLKGTLSLNVQDEQEKGTQYGLYGIYSSLYNYCGTNPQISQEIQSYEKNLETNIEADSISINTKVKSGPNSAIDAESSIVGKVTGENSIVLESKKGNINIQVTNGTIIKIDGSPTNKTEVNLKSAKDNIFIVSNDISYSAPFRAALLVRYGKLNVQTDNGINKLESTNNLQAIEVAGGDVCLKGKENIISAQGGGISLLSKPRTHNDKGLYQNKTEIIATQGNNSLSAVRSGLNSEAETTLIFDAKLGNNIIKAIDTDPALSVGGNSSSGIVYSTGGCISLLANEDSGWNIISPNSENVSENNLFNLAAIRARSEKQTDDNQIYLKAYANKLLGSVVSEDVSKITVDGTKNYISSGSWREIINKGTYSYAVMTMNSAHGTPKIDINASEAGINEIKVSDVYSGLGSSSERVVYAADKGVININGTSNISTASWIDENAEGYQYNNTSMALVAAATENADDFVDPDSLTYDDRSHINLNYGKGSTITGDIVSGYGGDIRITEQTSANTASARAIAPAMTIRGNVLAGNGGKLNLELGEGSFWYGRADDYQDAGEDHGADNSFYNPAFSNEITSSGTVDVKLATNATWKMLGQSWLTSLDNNGVVDLSNEFVSSTTDSEVSIENTHALTVQKLTGNGTFVMSLDHTDHANSDMLYAKNATGTYTLQLKEMPNGWENIDKDNALRFATLQGGATFNPEVEVVNQGAQNYKLLIEARPYEVNDEENAEYNGDGGLTLAKPGQDNVDDFFELSEDKGEEITTVSLAKVNEESVDALAEETADSAASEINNFVISQAVSTGLSDIGRTILNMSRANYANAVYMDTLNKRQGEARFGMSEDNGVWVRLRHDNIGKEDSFRTHNTMLELGYDIKNLVEGGQWHTGIALDYMNGQSDYHNVSGDGDIQRYGAWFYSTWLSDSGHYADFVLKYGHLKNDFDIYTPEGYNVTGDYSNNVVSISGEYGYKFANAAGWFAEPQVQLQYSYVSEADYTTSQGTKVEVDSIDSLIARAGVRLGKEFNAEYPISLYLRADVLHEFLGDQDLSAIDESRIDVTYENDDTWYSAGVGLSVMTSPNTYFFIEGEQVFGADNDDTYTLSGGFRHNF